MQQHAGNAQALQGAHGQHAVPAVAVVQARGEPGDASAFQGVPELAVAEVAGRIGIAQGRAQRAFREERALRQEHQRCIGGQADLAAAPGPKTGYGLEQADGHGGVAGNQDALAAPYAQVEMFQQHFAIRVGQAQVIQAQVGRVAMAQLDAMLHRLAGLLLQIEHVLVQTHHTVGRGAALGQFA